MGNEGVAQAAASVTPIWRNEKGWCVNTSKTSTGFHHVATYRNGPLSGAVSFEQFDSGAKVLCVEEDGVMPTLDVIAELLRREAEHRHGR